MLCAEVSTGCSGLQPAERKAAILVDDLFLARIVHVLAVLQWIGGVAFVTVVLLGDRGVPEAALARFLVAERRFAPQARIAVLVAGAGGFCLVQGLDLWWRHGDPAFSRMHATLLVFLVFALALFVAEPLVLHPRFERARSPACGLERRSGHSLRAG